MAWTILPSQPAARLVHPLRPQEPIQIDPARADANAVATASTEFGTALLDRLGDGSVVCSPYSIATALQMTLLGARGTTAAEMYETLRLAKLSPSELASTAAVLRHALPKHLSVSNALWPDRSLPLEPDYVRTVEQGFGPKTTRLDFAADPETARKTINAAIAAATHDKIPELLKPGTIDASTIMVLTNAIYLKAQWALPFDEAQTRDGTFTRDGGTTVNTPMMQQDDFSYGYRDGDGYQLIRLPYNKTSLALSIVLPDGPLSELGDYDLTSILHDMGMRTAFTGNADFSGMTSAKPSISKPPPPQLDVTLDRPFLFAITDTKTGAPLFLGRVLDPNQG